MTRNIILDANLGSLSNLVSMLQDYRFMDCSSLTLSVFMGLLRTSASSLILSLKGILEDRKIHFLLTSLSPKQLRQLNYCKLTSDCIHSSDVMMLLQITTCDGGRFPRSMAHWRIAICAVYNLRGIFHTRSLFLMDIRAFVFLCPCGDTQDRTGFKICFSVAHYNW